MKTPEEILKQHAPGIILFGAGDGSVHKWNAVIKAMEEYAKEYASQELQRLSKENEELRDLLDRALACGDYAHQATILEIKKICKTF